jgi:hypothetical protein
MSNVPQDVIDQVLEPVFIKWMHDYFCSDEGTITRKTYERMFDAYKAGCQNDELRAQRQQGAEPVYQRQYIVGNWKDVDEEEYNIMVYAYPRRIVYTTPPQANAIVAAFAKRLSDEWMQRVKAIGRDCGSYRQCSDEILSAIINAYVTR